MHSLLAEEAWGQLSISHVILGVVGATLTVFIAMAIKLFPLVKMAWEVQDNIQRIRRAVHRLNKNGKSQEHRIRQLESWVRKITDTSRVQAQFMVRRAESEAHEIDWLDHEGRIPDKIRSLYIPYEGRLKQFCRDHNCMEFTDDELYWMIENEFGEEFKKTLCIPNKLKYGACLTVASKIARENIAS